MAFEEDEFEFGTWFAPKMREFQDGIDDEFTEVFASYIAEVQEITDIALNTELGRDPRESVLLHVPDRAAAAALNSNQTVTINLYGDGQRFLVVRRSDNPSSPTVEFGLAKLTDKDQL